MLIKQTGVPSNVDAPVPTGSSFRVFGRSLAWVDATACVRATRRQSSHTTMLVLTPHITQTSDVTLLKLPATQATCYEATFIMGDVPPGAYTAQVENIWGASPPWVLQVVAAPPTPSSVTLDVDAMFDGM